MNPEGQPISTLHTSNDEELIEWNLLAPVRTCLIEHAESVSPALHHVSEEFIKALALGRSTSLDLTAGLKRISRCPKCAERLDTERNLIGLIRTDLDEQTFFDDQQDPCARMTVIGQPELSR